MFAARLAGVLGVEALAETVGVLERLAGAVEESVGQSSPSGGAGAHS